MKKILYGIFATSLLVVSLAFALPAKATTAPAFNVSGSYTWLAVGTYSHDMTLAMNPDGTFTGTGGYPSGGAPYTDPSETGESITNGVVSGNDISFTLTYTGPYATGSTWNFTGTIAPDGSMSGNIPMEWHSTSGHATTLATNNTVVVSANTSAGENLSGWMFNRDTSTATPYEFNTTTSSIGTGALYVKPIGTNAADKFIAENFINAPLSTVNSIAYDFKIGSGGDATDANQFYMSVYTNFGVSDDLKFYDCRYDVVPTVGSTGGFTTVTFDPTMSYSVTTRGGATPSPYACPAIPADMNTLSAGSNIRAFALNVGDTSTSDVGLDGYLDKVVVNTDTSLTTYNFDPAPVTPTYALTTVVAGTGSGVITSSPAGINCGADCSESYNQNTAVTLTATPASGSTFTSWSGACTGTGPCTVTIDAAKTVTATFTLSPIVVGYPTDKDQCKNGGWKNFTNPQFKNQGQCVAWTNHN